mgnify:CR=1 FL=1
MTQPNEKPDNRTALNRLQAVTQAQGIKGHEARMNLAADYALNFGWMTTDLIIATVQVAIPDSDQATAPQATAPAPVVAKLNTLPDAHSVYAARRTQKGAAQ